MKPINIFSSFTNENDEPITKLMVHHSLSSYSIDGNLQAYMIAAAVITHKQISPFDYFIKLKGNCVII